MLPPREAVITGLGIVSPIGLTREAFWQSLVGGQSGVSRLEQFNSDQLPPQIGGAVRNFDAKLFVTPRKSLKVMSREIQLGFAAARLALEDAALEPGRVDADRFGVVFGAEMIYIDPAELEAAYRSCLPTGKFDFAQWGAKAMGEMFPLWMLKYLPNMPACHIAISNDARGPNNSVLMGEASSLLALAESMRLIERGLADIVITGGAANRLHPMAWVFRRLGVFSDNRQDPAGAMRPFDADRDGTVYGEGATAFVLETRQHALARGRQPLARVLSYASAFEPARKGQPLSGSAIRVSIGRALEQAGISAADLDHVNANGSSAREGDRVEAQAIRDLLGDVPVTAPKSFFGNLGAATGATEMAASVLAFEKGSVPPTLNYRVPDPQCPVNVIHGEARPSSKPFALLLNQSTTGQAVAVVLAKPEA